ncbi:hypothetical protein F8M41_003767 [Gigaspora margarita]|uniref:Uncharacterized protein n=1 Tax=Gigaspora margarita TaxID=4874 RepID=A0A8H3XAT8_GIGMA|nr:hypothetical protein F8M41_003767 [Gigaspora margarita]
MSMRYAKEKGLTSNQGDKIGGCIPNIEVEVDDVKMVQKFYIKRQLSSDVILGMLWVAKTRCATSELMKSDNVDYEGKKSKDINKSNNRESNSMKVINSKDVPMKSDHQDEFEVVDNMGEAADGKMNKSRIRYQAKCDVRSFIRLSDLSYQKVKVSGVSEGKDKRLVFEDSIKSTS